MPCALGMQSRRMSPAKRRSNGRGNPCQAVMHQSGVKFISDVCLPQNHVASNLKKPASSSNEASNNRSGNFTDMARMTGEAGDHAVSKLKIASPLS